MEGGPPFTPQIVISGLTAGGVHALWVSEDPPWCTHIVCNTHLAILKDNFKMGHLQQENAK